jgi:hypothetical protein
MGTTTEHRNFGRNADLKAANPFRRQPEQNRSGCAELEPIEALMARRSLEQL